jgi:O-antigen ligase
MDKAKRKIINLLLFIYLVLFPFGQLARWELVAGNYSIPIHLADVVAGIFLLVFLIFRPSKPPLFRHIKNFLYLCLFSWLTAWEIFGSPLVAVGGLYLLRLWAYAAFFVLVWNISRQEEERKRLFNLLLGISCAVAIFGWFQYVFYPDVRALLEWGWDEHLYRLVGTFLDPTFTSIILVFGFILALAKKKTGLALFFLLTVAFTYARAGYLALLAGSLAILAARHKVNSFLFVALALLTILIILPRPAGEGVKLARTNSILARFENYGQTIGIFAKSPLLGVGYNNFCLARNVYLGDTETASHACSGSDASLLLILATTGVLGLLVFGKLVLEIFRGIQADIYGTAFIGSSMALAVHGIFANSYFYPWVMGFMGVLLALSLKKN